MGVKKQFSDWQYTSIPLSMHTELANLSGMSFTYSLQVRLKYTMSHIFKGNEFYKERNSQLITERETAITSATAKTG